MRRAAIVAALVASGLQLVGCGLTTLMHDSILGPVSPIGRIHDVTVGRDFRVGEQGPVADTAGEPILRPLPPDVLERLGSPSSFYSLVQGLQFFVAGFSPIVRRDTQKGKGLTLEQLAVLRPGLDVSEVLPLLGPPQLWIRRKEGSLMAYRADTVRQFSFYLGVPPGIAALIPVPGLGSLRFRSTRETSEPHKTLLFFGADEKLREVASQGKVAEDRE